MGALASAIQQTRAVVFARASNLAPHFKRWSGNQAIRSFVDGVTAGAPAGAAFVLGRRAIIDSWTLAIAVAALAIAARFRKVPGPALILPAGVVGVLLKRLG